MNLAIFRLPIAPEQASTFARQYDWLFYVTTALTIFFTVVVCLLVLYFAIKYRRGNKVDRKNAKSHNLALELTWSIIPLIMGLAIFGWASWLFVDSRQPPEDAMDVYVIGKQWMWHAQHSNGVRENNMLHVPAGRPVRLTMISQDVIHSFYIPAFRMKQDVVPGRYTQMWFTPTKPGVYNLFCAEYCGTQHSEMGGFVVVMEPQDFAEWLAAGGDTPMARSLTMAERGELIFKEQACDTCHGDQDNPRGPSLVGIYGQPRPLDDGRVVIADDAYLREAIYEPGKHIVRGYDNTMPSYRSKDEVTNQGGLTEEQVVDLIAYMRSLRLSPEPAPRPPQPQVQPEVQELENQLIQARTTVEELRGTRNRELLAAAETRLRDLEARQRGLALTQPQRGVTN